MTITIPTPSVRLRRLVPAALFAAAVALGGSAVADPAIASAEREWDIGYYESCMLDAALADAASENQRLEWYQTCCEVSGGVWIEAAKDCGAPPHPDYQRPLPPRAAPGAETSAPLEPVLVTPTTQTLAPGPAKQGS